MILGSALIALAVVGLAIAFRVKARAKLQSTWLRVPGTVIRSAVVMGTVFMPDVQYQYVHDGKVVRADRIRTLSLGFGWRGPAERTVLRYRVGSTPDVFVDPTDPESSVLEPGGDPNFLPFAFTLAAMCAYVGIRMLLSATAG